MQSFLGRLADEIISGSEKDFSRTCVVFPTRRAGLYFKKIISEKISSPVWSPAVYSVEDFIPLLTGLNIPDRLTLLFELHLVYDKYLPGETFDRFYPWGLMLLKDFDDIDRNLVNGEKLFTHLGEFKKIESDFAFAPEELEAIRRFWATFSDQEVSQVKSEFLKIWNVLGTIYSEFRQILLSRNLAYEGLALRSVSENISRNNLPSKINLWDKIYFAGFYALSRAEQEIIRSLIRLEKGEIRWDADFYYTEDETQEAGKFFRKQNLSPGDIKWKERHFETGEKNITVTGVPLQAGQAKAAGQILHSLGNKIAEHSTAVVLPDENLLFPVLYSIPEEIESINITMGYPLHATPLFTLYESLVKLQKNSSSNTFYHRDVIDIITHPYFRSTESEKTGEWLKQYSRNGWIRISIKNIVSEEAPAHFGLLFRQYKNTDELFSSLFEILRFILSSLEEKKQRHHSLEAEYLFHFYNQLKRLQDITGQYNVILTTEIVFSLLREMIRSTRIPFTGEPLKGLQIMGFLETRVLDFENIILLSVNEGILPSTAKNHSFIPWSLRKGYGLPTFEDQDAIYAYHFYRLLQRAKNIHLLYNTESKSISGGEKSRFILQIEQELKKKMGDKLWLNKKIIATEIRNEGRKEIEIHKGKEVLKKLERYTVKSGTGSPVYRFSASALQSYINCSLQFYFRYAAGLKEKEEIEERIEDATFGNIFHKAMYRLYHPHPLLTKELLEKMIPGIPAAVYLAIEEEFPSSSKQELWGKNRLLKNVLQDLVLKTIRRDLQDAPIRIHELEKEYSSSIKLGSGTEIALRGIIDRLDETGGTMRVLDYKTGKAEIKKYSLEELFTDPKNKIPFQAFYYSYLYHRNQPGTNIRTGIYTIKKFGEGILYLNEGAPVTKELFSEFEQHLTALLAEIFDSSISFRQTEEKERCSYCPYKEICCR